MGVREGLGKPGKLHNPQVHKFLSFRISQAGELSLNDTYLKLSMGEIEQGPL